MVQTQYMDFPTLERFCVFVLVSLVCFVFNQKLPGFETQTLLLVLGLCWSFILF